MSLPDMAGKAGETITPEEKIEELEQELINACEWIEQLREENARLKEEVRSYEAFKRNIDEALNSGDGVYRP